MAFNPLRKFSQNYVLRPLKALEFSEPVWLYLNRKPKKLFRENPPHLNNLQSNILAELKQKGVATTHIDELFLDEPEIFQDILSRLDQYVKNATQDPKKPHFYNLWDTRVFPLDPVNGFTKLALSPKVIDVANSYMGMWTRFLLSNAYIGKIGPGNTRVNTQNWHRDMHDRRLVMAFLYLTDVVDEGYGPFWYIEGSHVNKAWESFFPTRTPFTKKPGTFEQEAVDEVIPRQYQRMITGKRGTIIFADTKGLHRGGHCSTNERIVSVSGYASDHRFSKSRRFAYPNDIAQFRTSLSDQAGYAVDL